MKRQILAAFYLLGGTSLGMSQALFQSGRDDSAILFTPSGSPFQFQLNTAGTTYSLVYASPKSSERRMQYGFHLGGKANGSSVDLFKNNSVGTTVFGQVALRFPKIWLTSEEEGVMQYDELALLLSYSQESVTTFDTGTTVFGSESFGAFRVALNYWGQTSNSLFFGARVGAGIESNANDVSSSPFVGLTELGGTTISKSAIPASAYEERLVYPVRLDVMHQFSVQLGGGSNQTLGLDFFAKKNSVGTADWQPGVALLIFKPGDPLSALGGISAAWKKGKVTVGLFAGYKF